MKQRLPSALDTVARLASGELNKRDLLDDTLARIDALEPSLGAFTALLMAETAHAQLEKLQGQLQGMPVAVKDIFDTQDFPTAYGSTIYAGAAPRIDAAIVSVIRRAGGLVIGKSSTTEFAFLNPTSTKNPNAPGRTPGGSSAGSAAAVAAGLVPFAVGTQTGGSVIRPASYCGVTGFKPTYGLLPTPGLKPFSWSLDTVGVFARSVREAAWFAGVLSGTDLTCADALQRKRPWHVAVPDAYPWGDISPSGAKAIQTGTEALEAAGATVESVTFPAWMKDVFEAQDIVQGYEAWRALSREFDDHEDALSPILRDYLLGAAQIKAQAYEAAQFTATEARQACTAWFGGFDVVMTPSAPDEAPAGYGSTGASTFNRAWTLLGLPCVNVAGALGVNGFPMGLQVIGGPRADRVCLEAADFLEQALLQRRQS